MAKQNRTNKTTLLKFFGRNLYAWYKKRASLGGGGGRQGGQQATKKFVDMKAQNLYYEVVDLQGGDVRNSIMNL
jgi:hypothetical protein